LPLGSICQHCETPNQLGDAFCKSCGQPLAPASSASARFGAPDTYTPKHLAERILLSRAALEGERKQVTVLFADLKGSMELLADRDPEEARKLLDPVLERMMEAVHRYEGTVNQVMGDGIMALFGAPVAHEDHGVRACYAALAMQSAIHAYSEQAQRTHGLAIWIRIGLNSGEVVVRAIGGDLHMDYTAVGQTTHLAARMEQLAAPGSTLLTAATLELVEGFVSVKTRGPVPVKGMAEPVEVYELTGAGEARSRLQAAAARGLTKFVGRSAELSQLSQALEGAQAGHGEIVAVVGEPGVGKSRLFYEFTHSHRMDHALVLEAGSVSYGKATAYRPVIDLFKIYFQIEERDDTRKMRERVTGKLLTLDRQLEPLLPPLLALLDVPVEDTWQRLDPAQKRLRILDACKRLLIRETQVQPVVAVFEDLHWIDNETQAFLDSLVEALPATRLLLLVNYRPEYQHRWGAKTYYAQLRIDPLTGDNAEALLHALLGDDASLLPLKRMLIERTEGNPLFVEESVRTLLETGDLQGSRGAYRLSAPASNIQVPATVHAILAARIDRLSPEDKRLLQAAAVVGKDVPYALLQAIAELPEEPLRQGLSNLQAAEFMYEMSLFPDLEYTFKHALTHEVAYGGVLQERRRALHGRIVDVIEHLYADRLTEQVEQLAHHAFRAEAWEKAARYLRQAGDKAWGRSATREAASAFQQALTALAHLPQARETLEQTVDLQFMLCGLFDALTEPVRSFDYAREAQALALKLDDPVRRAWGVAHLCYGYVMLGEPAAAVEHGEAAFAIATDLADKELTLSVSFWLALAYMQQGRHRKAAQFLLGFSQDPAASVPETSCDGRGEADRGSHPKVRYEVWSRAQAARCFAELGAFDSAIACGEKAERAATISERPWDLGGTDLALGYVYLYKGDLDTSVARLERCLQISRTADVPMLFINAAPQLGCGYNLLGRISESITLLEQARDMAEATRYMPRAPLIYAHLGEAYALAGRMEQATAALQRALDLARQHGKRSFEAWALYLMGKMYTLREPVEEERARQAYTYALSLAEELEMRPLQGQCHLALGLLSTPSSNAARSRQALSTAATMFREMDMQFWLEKAQTALNAL
jgi:class 3 adenylate cyclase/tetratricopeptide (TPR) repeat protein